MKELKLKYSESHPLKKYGLNEQLLTKEEFVKKFEDFQWLGLLELLLDADENQIYHSPSLNIEDEDGKGISVSIVGELDKHEFYVCYKRPITRKKKKWFGFVEYDFFDEDYCSVVPGQTKEDALEAFTYFYEKDFEELDKRW